MHPYLFRLDLPWGGQFKAASYGMMILLGFLASLWLFQRRGRRMGMPPAALFDAAVFGLLGGVLGARLFYIADHWAAYADQGWLEAFRIWHGGLSFFGGLVGGSMALFGTIFAKKLPLRQTLGVAASVMPLGHAFGRMGCFLNGCCFGKVTDLWLGLRFPRIVEGGIIAGSLPYVYHLQQGLITRAATRSLPIHPTQLYAVTYLLAIFGLLSYLLPRRRRAGDVAWVYPIAYGVARFGNEFLRADTVGQTALGGLTQFQALAIGAVVFGAVMLGYSLAQPPEPIPDPWTPPEGSPGPPADAAE